MKYSNLKVIIPVREGSQRIKRKVLLPFKNTTLYEWKIMQLIEVLSPENIIVSTDSEKLMEIAYKYGIGVHRRDKKYCIGNEIPFSEVVYHVVSEVEAEHIAWVPCVVPLMSPEEYREGFKQYFIALEEGYDSLVAFNLLKEYLWDDDGPINYSSSHKHIVSQNLPNIYRVTNGLYMAPKNIMLKRRYFIGFKPYKYIVSKLAGIDIDYLEDYEMALALIDMYHKQLQKLNSRDY